MGARPVPVCADESCHDRASLSDLRGKYDMVNIKLDKAGGLTEALALSAEARARGLEIMVGCMVATSLAMAPAMLLAQDGWYAQTWRYQQLSAAVEQGDQAPFERLLSVLQQPFQTREGLQTFEIPASAQAMAGYRTFCGT